MSRFKKGESGNPAGRPAGSENKATADLRASIKSFLEKNWPKVQREFNKMEPKDKLLFIDKLLSYSLPKLQAVQMDADISFENLPDEKIDLIIEKIINA